MMTKEQIAEIFRKKFAEVIPEIADALMEFQANPNAETFRNAENTPHNLTAHALDKVIGEVLRETLDDRASVRDKKTPKKTGATDSGT
jgi:hypothetical protein